MCDFVGPVFFFYEGCRVLTVGCGCVFTSSYQVGFANSAAARLEQKKSLFEALAKLEVGRLSWQPTQLRKFARSPSINKPERDQAPEFLFFALVCVCLLLLQNVLASDGRAYLAGNVLTEIDVFAFSTLLRFDLAYFYFFRCDITNLRAGFPLLHAYLLRLLQNEARLVFSCFLSFFGIKIATTTKIK